MQNKLFNFCPNCGKQNHTFQVNKFHCLECDYVYFHNTAGAVAVFIEVGEEVLFTKRNLNPQKGFYDLPGGFTDYDESSEQTVIREIQEELKLDVSNEKIEYLGSNPNEYEYKNVVYHTLDLFYKIKLNEKPTLELQQSEISTVAWRKLNELDLTTIAFESQRKFIEKLVK